MKKRNVKKLSLEKLKVSKLTSLDNINGGSRITVPPTMDDNCPTIESVVRQCPVGTRIEAAFR